MPYDTNGNYSLPTIYYAISGTVINPAQHNTPLEDVRAALNQTLLRNGTAAMTGSLNANGNKVTNLAAAINDSDAANYGQVRGVLTNVPSVTDWTKYQAIGAADADGRYIRSPANPNTDARILTISRNKTSGGIFAAADDGSNTQLQPAGDYATRDWANSSFLQTNQPETQVVSGEVFFSGPTGFNLKTQNAPAPPTTGVGGDVPNTWWVEQYYARAGDYATNTALTQGLAGKQPVGDYALLSQLPLDPNKIVLAWSGYVGGGDQSIPFPRGVSSVDTVVIACSRQVSGNKATAVINVQGWNNSSVQVNTVWVGGASQGNSDTNYRAILVGNK